jgi:putative ATPase
LLARYGVRRGESPIAAAPNAFPGAAGAFPDARPKLPSDVDRKLNASGLPSFHRYHYLHRYLIEPGRPLSSMVKCPICDKDVKESNINPHIDSGCQDHLETGEGDSAPPTSSNGSQGKVASIFNRKDEKKAPGALGGGMGGSKYANEPLSTPAKRTFGNSFGSAQGGSNKKVFGGQSKYASPTAKKDPPPQTTPSSASNKPLNPPTSATPAQAMSPQPKPPQPAPPPATGTKRAAEAPLPTAGTKRAREDDDEAPVAPDSAKRVKPNSTNTNLSKAAPLAERMRPRTLDEVLGQTIVSSDGVLRALVKQDRLPSLILWGGPGTGKTTIARILANESKSRFVEINSTSTGVAECKKLFQEARNELGLTGRRTIIFCDEIHRFSKSQQDVFLGPVEAGLITLIGATTENPSFKVISALLSRCRVFTLAPLGSEALTSILKRAVESLDPKPVSLLSSDEFLSYLTRFAAGDARTALNLLELAYSTSLTTPDLSLEELKKSLTQTHIYDRAGDAHYDAISALHKSLRGSDADGALYYLARMLTGGEDPLFIARRLVVFASEDVGLADNTLLPLAVAAYTAVEKVGLPEARINLAHCVCALAEAKKSTRSYRGLNAAWSVAENEGRGLAIPVHLRNAPTKLMKEMGVGKEYKYNPDYQDGRVKQEYLPVELKGSKFLSDRDLGVKIDPDLEELTTPQDDPAPEVQDTEEEPKDDHKTQTPTAEPPKDEDELRSNPNTTKVEDPPAETDAPQSETEGEEEQVPDPPDPDDHSEAQPAKDTAADNVDDEWTIEFED